MKWNQLKTLALIVLLLLDAVFGFLVYSSYKSDNYYDEKTVSGVTAILEKSRIYLDGAVLTEKIVSLPVLSGPVSEEETAAALALLGAVPAEETEEGISYTADKGVFTVDRNRTLRYRAYTFNGASEEKAVAVENADKIKLSVAEKVTAFLKLGELTAAGKKKGTAFSLHCRSVLYEPESGVYTAELCLLAGGTETDVCLSAVLNEEEVLYLDGTMLFAPPAQSQTAGGVNTLTCLLREKTYIDSLVQSGSPSSVRVIEEVSYRYAVYFDLKGNYYLTPVCSVHYHDKSVSSYDMMTGERLETSE